MSYYQRHLFFCTNVRSDGRPCCQDHDAQSLRDYAKRRIKELGMSGAGRVRVNNAGCLDRCDEGPVMVVYPDAIWYTCVDKDDVEEIIQEHILKGQLVERLKI